ncbi:MAG: hypothetical protein ABI874_00050 [Chloroflexota bacterium]
MLSLLRPILFWLAAPIILVLGTVAGIHSVPADQPPVRPGSESAVPVRKPPFVVAGRIVRFDLAARTVIVQRRDGKEVNVLIRSTTVVKIGPVRARPINLNVGDAVTVVGRPMLAQQRLDATLITVMPRLSKPPEATAVPH